MRAFLYAADQPWAITQDALRNILEIASRAREDRLDIEALEAKLGRRLDNTRTTSTRDGVANIPITGPIFRYADSFSAISGATSTETIATDFTSALNDPSVKAILLSIDSPGGEVAGINELAAMVYAARGKKPITAYVGGMGASAAYWIGSAADEIVAEETALLGSIGIVATYRDTTAKDKRLGVQNTEIVSSQSPYKRIDPHTDTGKERVQAMIDGLAQSFVDTVARNRGIDAEKVIADFGQGGLLQGAQAVAAGMADRLGSFESTLTSLAGQPQLLPSRPIQRIASTQQEAIMAAEKTTEEKQTEKVTREVEKQNETPADPNEPLNRVPSPANPNVDPKTKPGPTEGPDKPGEKASASDARFSSLHAEVASLRERAERAEKIASEERDARLLGEYSKRAEKEYPNVPGTPEEKGRVLKALDEKLDATEAKALKIMLASGNNAMSTLMRERGTTQPGAGSAIAELEAIGAQISREEKCSIPMGIARAAQRHPELHKREIAERGN